MRASDSTAGAIPKATVGNVAAVTHGYFSIVHSARVAARAAPSKQERTGGYVGHSRINKALRAATLVGLALAQNGENEDRVEHAAAAAANTRHRRVRPHTGGGASGNAIPTWRHRTEA